MKPKKPATRQQLTASLIEVIGTLQTHHDVLVDLNKRLLACEIGKGVAKEPADAA